MYTKFLKCIQYIGIQDKSVNMNSINIQKIQNETDENRWG